MISERRGFTLIELLVVIAIIAVLAAITVSSMHRIIEMARATTCTSNLRGMYTANYRYAIDTDSYVAAAEDMMSSSNLRRWHGTRSSQTEPFDRSRSPLNDYYPGTAKLRTCPSLKVKSDAPNAFEASCGGYGYNIRGVGSMAYSMGQSAAALASGTSLEGIADPSATVMFCDTAFGQPYGQPDHLIEYSFAEAYHFVDGYGGEFGQATPSIHFRHAGKAVVVWCDGHVTQESMDVEAGPEQSDWDLGWFGQADNALFDTR